MNTKDFGENNTEVNKKAKGSGSSITKIYTICITIIAIMSLAVTFACIILGVGNSNKTGSYVISDGLKEDGSGNKYDSKEDGNIEDDVSNAENPIDNEDGDLTTVEGIKRVIKDYMTSGKGTIDMLRELYPESIVVYDNNKYAFLPVDESLKKNTIDNSYFEKFEDGEIVYTKEDKVVSVKGIDVSKYQGEIDWEKVAKDGVEYAIIRIGYRGYGTGAIILDENAIKNLDGATKAGIDVGVYFFSQAVTKAEAVEEAEFVLENIKKYDITYPVVFDTEDVYGEDARADLLDKKDRTDIAVAFCDTIEKAGYTPAVYSNLKWFNLALDLSKLEKYDKWYAYYDDNIYFPYEIAMWQYSESGKVSGIEGPVDMNISFKKW